LKGAGFLKAMLPLQTKRVRGILTGAEKKVTRRRRRIFGREGFSESREPEKTSRSYPTEEYELLRALFSPGVAPIRSRRGSPEKDSSTNRYKVQDSKKKICLESNHNPINNLNGQIMRSNTKQTKREEVFLGRAGKRVKTRDLNTL